MFEPREKPLFIGTKFALITFTALLLLASTVAAQEQVTGAPKYRTPPPELVELAEAPVTPSLNLGPGEQWGLILHYPSMPSIADLARPELRIAGIRVDPGNNGPSRARYFNDLTLIKISDGGEVEVAGLPDDPRISNVEWSPDGQRIAFTVATENAVQLWLLDVESREAKHIQGFSLNAAFYGSPFYWLPDGSGLLCRVVDAERGKMPAAPEVPEGPEIQENVGEAAPARTYQDLLENAYDEALFEFYASSRLLLVETGGEASTIGETALIAGAEPSPDGKYILVETIHRPFSYLVPYYRFPHRVEIWDFEGNVVKLIADLPLAEQVPIAFDAVPTGPRSFSWRQDAAATLCWVEATDEGDPAVEADVRDRLFALPAPFECEPTRLMDLGLRFAGTFWSEDGFALVISRWWKTRRIRTWMINPEETEAEPRLIHDRSFEDRYNDPGTPVFRRTGAGTYVLRTTDDGKTLFLIGQGASPEGNRPFFDKFDLETGETTRLWRSEAPYYEYPAEMLDDEGKLLLTRRESVTEQPNYFIRDTATGEINRLTKFPHPTPQLAEATKELIKYEREDGVELNATLYLPPGYTPEQGPLPMIMWAYPREFKSADAAGQVSGSPYSFVRIYPYSHLLFLARGYAILDGPTMPIIGEGEQEPNDTYVKQLVASAKAAVDEVARRGVADPDRIAIGGHSYGAFMVANLLAHSDLFAAGVARSGAYNRSLTPFGFQAEERTFWEAPEVYFAMSPFMNAENVNEPILLIHGAADNNSGTFPIQSRRFYHALKGLGATARLVMLPHESHGYQARESILHVLWETSEWLDKYVKNRKVE